MKKNKHYLIFNNSKLLIKFEDRNVLIPNEDEVKNFKVDLNNLELLTLKNEQEFLFGEISNLTFDSSQFQLVELRSLISSMDKTLFNLASKAFHLISWSKTYRYCSRCGAIAEDKKDERAKICPKCGYISYPRISPAIITAVIKDKKLLLAHNARFVKDMHSVLAGFVEPGETFEDCVFREVLEETGIKVKNIKYFGSQPWPFPDSLMVAFICEYESGEIQVDDVEIDHASWYSVKELPNIPFKGSIARNLIDWFIDNYK